MKYVAHGEYYIIKIGYGTTTKPIQNKRKWDIQQIKLQFCNDNKLQHIGTWDVRS